MAKRNLSVEQQVRQLQYRLDGIEGVNRLLATVQRESLAKAERLR